MSPEMVVGEAYTHKNDIWSLGILLYEMIDGNAPFQGDCREAIMNSMRQGVRFSNKFTEEDVSLIKSILKTTSCQRPEVVQILKHPFFAGQSELGHFTGLLGEPLSPCSTNRIKLLEVKLVKTKPNPELLSAAKSVGEKRDLLDRLKDFSNEPSTASNSVCEKQKISLRKF